MRILVFTLFITNNRPSFNSWLKETVVKRQEVSKYYENDCLQNFLLRFMSLLKANFVKNIHIWARIYFLLAKNLLQQNWNSFNTKFQPQSKLRKSSYEVTQLLAVFCYLIALILGENSVKGFPVTKIFKEIMFGEVWDELESKGTLQRQ